MNSRPAWTTEWGQLQLSKRSLSPVTGRIGKRKGGKEGIDAFSQQTLFFMKFICQDYRMPLRRKQATKGKILRWN